MWNHFNEENASTRTKHVYYSSVIFNEHIYQLKITDMPSISNFPADSYVEWTDFRCYGLRNANAYIFVFDLSNLETFQYIRIIRDQIAESRDIKNVPILIIGNKQDLITNLHRTHFSYLSGYVEFQFYYFRREFLDIYFIREFGKRSTLFVISFYQRGT